MDLHFLTIKKFLHYLTENYVIESEVNSLVRGLYSKGCLTHDDLDEIREKKSPIEKMNELSQRLLLQTENKHKYEIMYETLIKEFANKGRKHIVEKLIKTLKKTSHSLDSEERSCYLQAIRDRFQYLVENYGIDCQIMTLADNMYSNDFIDLHDFESINKTKMSAEKMSKLLQNLLRREMNFNKSKNLYMVLVDEISKNRRDVADELNKTLNRMEERKKNEEEYRPMLSQYHAVKHMDETTHEPFLEPGSGARHTTDTSCGLQALSINVDQMNKNHNSKEVKKDSSHTRSTTLDGVEEKCPLSSTNQFYPSSGYTSAAVAKKLMDACCENDVDGVRKLLDEGTDVNASKKGGWSALMDSSKRGHTAIVEMLVKHPDIEVNARDVQGTTALVEACYQGHHGVIKLLMEHKNINVNLARYNGITPLMIAARKDPDMVLKLLNHQDIDVNARNEEGSSALMHAKKPDVVHLLLSSKDIDVNLANDDACTALMLAAKAGKVLLVEKLLKHSKIDVSKKNRDNKTALDMAEEAGYGSIVKMLRGHNRKVKG